MIQQKPSFIARNLRVCAYLGLLLCVAFVNLYSYYTSLLTNPVEHTWVIICFTAALFISPIKQWPSVVSTLILSHIYWQLVLYKAEADWFMVLLELVASAYLAFYAKHFSNSWQPSDFTGDIISYLPIIVPSYFIYGVFLAFRQWLIHQKDSTNFIVTADLLLHHLHLLEFTVGVNLTFLMFQWSRNQFNVTFNPFPYAIIIFTHLACFYVWPSNLAPLLLIMTASVYYMGIRGITFPSLIVSLSLPFIAYRSGTLLDYVNELNYAFLIFFSGLLGIIIFNVAEAAKKGESYRVMLSKSNLTGFSIAPLEVDTLRSKLKEKNQEISQAYAQLEKTYDDLEQKNSRLKTLTTSLSRVSQSYKNLAEIDQLTQLKSRHYFYNFLADGSRKLPYLLILIDLDNFKRINDHHGHNVGDEILRQCASVFNNMVPKGSFTARIGGEEFCIVLANKDIFEAQIFASQIRHHIRNTKANESASYIYCTASIGIAELAIDSALKEAMGLADKALYQSKSEGKNRTTLANASFIRQLKNDQTKPNLNAVIEGLKAGEFELYIQPICNNSTQKAVGFESLMRWHRADGSILSPNDFLDLALSPEAYPLFKAISLAQLVTILKQLINRDEDYYLSFNTDNTFINSTEFVTDLINQFKLAQINLNCLVLELPEKTALVNMERALNNIDLLQKNGVVIALDDFGMEHSNMDRIRDIPADIIKIDRSFITNMEGNRRSLAIIKALVSMAKELNFEIIAEGIETQAQAIILTQAGIMRAQGYFYGRPKPAAYWLEQIDSGHI